MPRIRKDEESDFLRQKRKENSVQIRRQQREEMMMKKRNMAVDEQQPVEPVVSIDVERDRALMAKLSSMNPAEQLEATIQIRRMLSVDRNPPVDEVIQMGCLPYLVRFLQNDADPKLQFEAAWAITNIASGESRHTRILVDNGASSPLIRLLTAPSWDLREQAVWALGNIAGDGAYCRDFLLNQGIINAMNILFSDAFKGLQSGSTPFQMTFMRNAAWTLSNLFRGKPAPDINIVGQAFPLNKVLLQFSDDEVQVDILWALSYITDGSAERAQCIIDAGLVESAVPFLAAEPRLVMPALRTIGNILTGTNEQTGYIIKLSIIPHLVRLCSSPKRTLRKEALWALSNIAAGTWEQIAALIDCGAFYTIIETVEKTDEYEICKEGAWVLANVVSCGNESQIVRLMKETRLLEVMVKLLDLRDSRLLCALLEGIHTILNIGSRMLNTQGENPFCDRIDDDGLSAIENLQSHASQEVYEHSCKIIEDFFGGDDDDDELFEPDSAFGGAGGFNFGGPTIGQPPAFTFQ